MADQINADHANMPTAQTGIPADGGVTYHGWDGERALGFKAVRVDGRIEYTYLRPALGDNGAPAVTLHQDRTGDAAGEPIATYAVFPPDVEALTVAGPHHAAPCDITLADVFFRPWTDTFAVGWEVIDPATDRRMVVYINPSTGDAGGDPESTPCVFVYQGTEGDPSIDGTRCYLNTFDDDAPGPSTTHHAQEAAEMTSTDTTDTTAAPTPEDAAILAAAAAVKATRGRWADLIAHRAARLTREQYPTAATVIFSIESEGGEDVFRPLEVRDDTHAPLWSYLPDATPAILGNMGDVTHDLLAIYNAGPADFFGWPEIAPDDVEGDLYAFDVADHIDAPAAPGGIARLFGPDDIETALRTLAEVWDGDDPDDVLSKRQKDVATRVQQAFEDDDDQADRDNSDAYAVRRFLDISIAHLPEHLAKALNGEDGVTAYELPHGWLLWVPEDPDTHAADYRDDFPAEVLAVQRYARERGCDYVHIDRDCWLVDGLPTWDH